MMMNIIITIIIIIIYIFLIYSYSYDSYSYCISPHLAQAILVDAAPNGSPLLEKVAPWQIWTSVTSGCSKNGPFFKRQKKTRSKWPIFYVTIVN